MIKLELQNGIKLIMGPDSELKVGIKKDSNSLLYALWSGRFYISSNALIDFNDNSQPGFITPSSICKKLNGNFEISIENNHLSTFTLYSGEIETETFFKKLKSSDIKYWWMKC